MLYMGCRKWGNRVNVERCSTGAKVTSEAQDTCSMSIAYLIPDGKNLKEMKGIIGKKIGMTSVFTPDGKQTAVTIIEAGPCVVTQVKTKETDGYTSLQLAFGEKKEKHTTQAEKNHFAKSNSAPKQFLK